MPQEKARQRARVYLRGGQTIDMAAETITLRFNSISGALVEIHAKNSVQGFLEHLRGDAVDAVVRLNEWE